MTALGEEVTAEIAGERPEMARDGFVKTVMNDTSHMFACACAISPHMTQPDRKERDTLGDPHRKRLTVTRRTLFPPGVLLNTPPLQVTVGIKANPAAEHKKVRHGGEANARLPSITYVGVSVREGVVA